MFIDVVRLLDSIAPDRFKQGLKERYRLLEYYKTNAFSNGTEYFSQVNVETNTGCNRKCRICPNSKSTRGQNYISDEIYSTVLQQLSSINFKGIFSTVFYNEPFLDNQLSKRIKQAKDAIPSSYLIIYTNGSLLNHDNIEEVVNAGADIITVSQYIDNLAKDDARPTISKLPKKLKKHIRYRILDDTMALSTRAGGVDVKVPIHKNICAVASVRAMVDYKGNVVLCTDDYYTENKLGNIMDRHILDIWNDKNYKRIRKELRQGIFSEGLCKRCAGQ